jgi:hypothetical protein
MAFRTNILDPGGQDRSHPRQEGQAVYAASIYRQWSGQNRLGSFLGGCGGARRQDDFIEPHVFPPLSIARDEHLVSYKTSRHQQRESQQQAQGLASGKRMAAGS